MWWLVLFFCSFSVCRKNTESVTFSVAHVFESFVFDRGGLFSFSSKDFSSSAGDSALNPNYLGLFLCRNDEYESFVAQTKTDMHWHASLCASVNGSRVPVAHGGPPCEVSFGDVRRLVHAVETDAPERYRFFVLSCASADVVSLTASYSLQNADGHASVEERGLETLTLGFLLLWCGFVVAYPVVHALLAWTQRPRAQLRGYLWVLGALGGLRALLLGLSFYHWYERNQFGRVDGLLFFALQFLEYSWVLLLLLVVLALSKGWLLTRSLLGRRELKAYGFLAAVVLISFCFLDIYGPDLFGCALPLLYLLNVPKYWLAAAKSATFLRSYLVLQEVLPEPDLALQRCLRGRVLLYRLLRPAASLVGGYLLLVCMLWLVTWWGALLPWSGAFYLKAALLLAEVMICFGMALLLLPRAGIMDSVRLEELPMVDLAVLRRVAARIEEQNSGRDESNRVMNDYDSARMKVGVFGSKKFLIEQQQ